jgi:hypothetical protein
MPGIDALLSVFDETKSRGRYKKAIYVFMGFLLVYVVFRGIFGAMQRLFWLDEIMTTTIAGQPSVHQIWVALGRGFDIQPPAFYLLERVALKLVAIKQLAVRLPSILAFSCTLLCVFVYAKKRSGEFIACISALMLLSTALFHVYLIEARPYNLEIACLAFALVCYQRLPSPFWAVMFAMSLVLAESFHYFAIVAMIPFGVAEIVFALKSRRIRWPVWIGLACATVPLIIAWPLLTSGRRFYGSHFFAIPHFGAVRQYYTALFLLGENALGLTVAVVAIVGVLMFYFWPHVTTDRPNALSAVDMAEGTLLLGLIALPFIAFVVARLMHGGLQYRYVFATTLGVVLGITGVLSVVGRKALAIFALVVFSPVFIRETTFWRYPAFEAGAAPCFPCFIVTSNNELRAMETFMQSCGHSEVPIVISDFVTYAQFLYYSQPDWNDRLVYLVDERRELLYSQADSVSKVAIGFSEFFPLRVQDYSKFISTHPEFLFYANGLDWNTPAFLKEGLSVQFLAEGAGNVYLIKTRDGRWPQMQ